MGTPLAHLDRVPAPKSLQTTQTKNGQMQQYSPHVAARDTLPSPGRRPCCSSERASALKVAVWLRRCEQRFRQTAQVQLVLVGERETLLSGPKPVQGPSPALGWRAHGVTAKLLLIRASGCTSTHAGNYTSQLQCSRLLRYLPKMTQEMDCRSNT